MRLKEKVAIVTGAASGLGASTARIFAQEGAKVVVADILNTEGKEIVSHITSNGAEAHFHNLDVTNEKNWDSLVKDTVSKYGQLNILVNNAGISGTSLDRMNLDFWDQLIEVNAKGVFLGMRAVVPLMQKGGGGSIINISSISAFVGQEYVHMGYNAAKGASRIMTKAAAVQFAEDGIRVNSVHPGVMPAMKTSQTSPALRKKMLSTIPLGREGLVEEVAYTNLFLASDESSYITGVELPVDGGYLAL
jgi:NAD(P)-dependent dehydrogenase (short-subunit alcohol dehydrogenase family)